MNPVFDIPLSAPHLSDADGNQNFLLANRNDLQTLRQETEAFEAELCTETGVANVALTSSGFTALQLTLAALGISAGDEVICQSLTFVATANAIYARKAIPVFIDSESETWNICPDTLEMVIKERIRRGKPPKAVIAVDVYGMPAQWNELETLCQRYGIPLIEDAAEALGSHYRGKPCGSFGRVAVLSFNQNKIITTLGGGAVLSNDPALIKRIRWQNAQAREDGPYYLHCEEGFNYPWAPMNSPFGRYQLQLLNDRVTRRRANFQFYRQALADLPGISFQHEPDYAFSNRWLTVLVVDSAMSGVCRETLRLALAQNGIESRPVFNPMHNQPIHKKSPFYGTGHAMHFFQNGLCLPSGSTLTQVQCQRVTETIQITMATTLRL